MNTIQITRELGFYSIQLLNTSGRLIKEMSAYNKPMAQDVAHIMSLNNSHVAVRWLTD